MLMKKCLNTNSPTRLQELFLSLKSSVSNCPIQDNKTGKHVIHAHNFEVRTNHPPNCCSDKTSNLKNQENSGNLQKGKAGLKPQSLKSPDLLCDSCFCCNLITCNFFLRGYAIFKAEYQLK